MIVSVHETGTAQFHAFNSYSTGKGRSDQAIKTRLEHGLQENLPLQSSPSLNVSTVQFF